MKTFKGKPLSPGYGEGRALVYHGGAYCNAPLRFIELSGIDGEIHRFDNAMQNSIKELTSLKEKFMRELGQAETGILDAHLALLKDADFIGKVKKRISEELVTVEHAVEKEIDGLAGLLAKVENEYLRERNQDIRDVGRRILKNLNHTGTMGQLRLLPPNTVLVTKELLPSDTLEMDRKNTVAIVTERGGQQSHAAILARSLGIPSVTGLEGIAKETKTGDYVLVDAQAGTITVSPSLARAGQFTDAKNIYDDFSLEEKRNEFKDSVTLDGVEVELFANIGRPEEVTDISLHYLKGVGLFRTEFLFMESPRPPSLELQTKLYCSLAKQLGKLPLTIRTLDLGGDKQPAFLMDEMKRNPELELRGLRYSLAHEDLFFTQLRAILRASLQGNVKILFPMVTGADELQEALKIFKHAAHLEKISDLPKIGAMIETPAAVFEINEILEIMNFVSIGTNDLTQFMLAADRNILVSMNSFSELHPSLLKAVKKIVDSSLEMKKDVCICGEAAGYPEVACLFAGMGVRQLSMSPIRTAKVRSHVRKHDLTDLQNFAGKSLKAKSVQEVLKILEDFSINKHATQSVSA
ncbi:MAG: phosphoenolpyruvate--protein phosphotransferase [Victivallaceae bacterium]